MIDLKKLKELVATLPAGLRADWDGTNHYELQTPGGDDFYWLVIPDVFSPRIGDWSTTEEGKRLGAVLDFACAMRAALPELLEEVEKLRNQQAEDQAKRELDIRTNPERGIMK